MQSKIILALILVVSVCGGCARKTDGTFKLPFVYRIDIQQGNLVEQDMINKLQPGMDKKQVRFVLGTPLITDAFHSNRWDYVYSMEPGKGERSQRRITVHFDKNDKLAYVDGDIKIGTPVNQNDDLDVKEDKAVIVPLKPKKEGFFEGWFKKDKPPEAAPPDVSNTEKEADTATETPAADHKAKTTDKKPDTSDSAKEATDTTAEKSTEPDSSSKNDKPTYIETQQEKNLLKRLWDRITSDSNSEDTEQSQRDAEIIEKSDPNK